MKIYKRLVLTVAFATAAVGGIVCWQALRHLARENPCAEIYVGGSLNAQLPLNTNAEYRVECDGGFNLVVVENGEVFVADADCPDRVCVETGGISGGAVPIVCLPHRVEVRVVNGANEVDAAVG